MSFLSVLKTIGSVFTKVNAVVQPLEPVIAAIPGGSTFDSYFNTIVQIEQLFEGVASTPASSAAKLSIASQVIAAKNPTVSPETIPPVVNTIVASLNALQGVQTSVAAPAAKVGG